MSPDRKHRRLDACRKPHVERRHAEPPPHEPPVAPTRRHAELPSHEAAAIPPELREWAGLGAELAALGPHRLAIAAHAARAAAAGGAAVGAGEEEQIAAWLAGIVDEAIRRGGGSGDDRDETAAAIWHVLAGDWHRDPEREHAARCPAVAAAPRPGAPGFLVALRAAARGYVYTAVAGASADDIAELRELRAASDDDLESYRPWGLVDTDDPPAAALLELALASLTLRRPTCAEICSGFGGWARGSAQAALEHTLSPVDRIGAIAWLARVALGPSEGARRSAGREDGAA